MCYRWIRQSTTPSFRTERLRRRLFGLCAPHKIGEQFERHALLVTVPIGIRGNRIPAHLSCSFIKRCLDDYKRELRERFLFVPLSILAFAPTGLTNCAPRPLRGTFLVALTWPTFRLLIYLFP